MEGELGAVFPFLWPCCATWGPGATRGAHSHLGVPDSSGLPWLVPAAALVPFPIPKWPERLCQAPPVVAAAEELREEVICSVCLDLFCTLVVLGCGRSF